MSKRKRNDVHRGEGTLSNYQDSVVTGVRSSQFQMEQATINAAPNLNDTKITVQAFNYTNLPCFFNLAPAETKLKEMNASQNADYMIFAFDRNAEGAKIFAIGQQEDFTTICFHRKTSNKLSDYNYEMLMDGEPMKLYCDCEYLEVDNPGKNKDNVLNALLYYISQAYLQVTKPSNWSNMELNKQDFLVETCHRDGKVSFHVKIPEKFGVVTSMSAQQAFWSHVVTLASNDMKSNMDEDRVRAEELRVFRDWNGKPFDDWVVDFSVYKDHSQCFRNLKAAKHPKQGQSTRPQDYLIPLGRSLQDITEDYWKESLIMNVSSKARTLEVPKKWFKTNEITQRKCQAIQMLDSEIYRASANTQEDIRRVDIDDNQFKLFSSLLIAIDPQWIVTNKNQLQVRYGYLNSKVDILPKHIYLFPTSKYCPIKRGAHDTCCSSMKIAQDGTMIISCFSSNHGGKPDFETLPHEGAFTKEKEVVMMDTWGTFRWMKELNTRYGFMKNPPTSGKCIVECHEKIVRLHNYDHLVHLFANCRAYHTQNQPRESFDPPFKEQQSQSVLRYTNPFSHWYSDVNRRNVDQIIFDPHSMGCAGDINTWRGLAIIPKQSDNPCSRLLNHIRLVLASNNQEHYEYLLNWLSWLVQRPEQKTGVAVVLVSDQGAGKSTLINVLQKIFGVHCLHITDSRNSFTPSTPHIEDKVLIVLNESTWDGDKAHEEWIKSTITDDNSPAPTKFGDIKSSTKNYWNLMFVSNHKWCYPASEDNRRFFCPTVSNDCIGDHRYFDELHDEIDNGGVEQFLYYLLNRQIPTNWTPAQFLPNRTKAHFEALMEDRKNGALKWFIGNLKQREWREYVEIERGYRGNDAICEVVSLILWDQPTRVPVNRFQHVWSLARENDRALQEHAIVKDIKQLEKFLEKLFDKRKDLFDYFEKKAGLIKTQYYCFGSMQDIRVFMKEFHGYDDWDNYEDTEDAGWRSFKKHKPSIAEEEIQDFACVDLNALEDSILE